MTSTYKVIYEVRGERCHATTTAPTEERAVCNVRWKAVGRRVFDFKLLEVEVI